jgi:amino acid permease
MRKINAWAVVTLILALISIKSLTIFFLQFLTFLLYMTSATLGYLAFPVTSAGSLLDTYPDSGSLDALRLLMAVSVILSYPIILFPTRENVDKLMFSGDRSCFASKPLTNGRFYFQNIILCWIAYGITVAIPQFRTILNLWGAFTGTFLGYIFPTVFYLKTSKIQFKADKKAWAALFMLIGGSLAGFVSVSFNCLFNLDSHALSFRRVCIL